MCRLTNQGHRLNLAVANHVHIVEPQWNPAVEEQAVARVLRMGQTRNVTVFRYVVENTVEQVSPGWRLGPIAGTATCTAANSYYRALLTCSARRVGSQSLHLMQSRMKLPTAVLRYVTN